MPPKIMKTKNKAHGKSKPKTKDQSSNSFRSPRTFEQNLAEEAYLIGAVRKRPGFIDPVAGFTKKQVNFLRKCNRINRGNSTSPKLIGNTGGIIHVNIKTAFSHPIEFFHTPAPNGSESCDWCKSPFYGLEGYGETTVEVIPAHDGHGYEEIGDGEYAGWGQKGHPPSRMCEACTLSRFDIISCEQHMMKSIEDNNPLVRSAQAWNRAIDSLVHGDEAGGQLILTAKFCAICSALADYRCSNKAEHLYEAGSGRVGCGLCLCETCNDLMSKMEIGKIDREINEGRRINVLDDVIREAMTGWAGYYGGDSDQHVRADASFLTTTGELYTRLLQGMGGYFDVSEPNPYDKTYDLTNGSSSDEGKSIDQDFQQIVERAMKKKAPKGDISKTLAPRDEHLKTTKFSDEWFGKPLHASVITPEAKSTPILKSEQGEDANVFGRPDRIDWMETHLATSKNPWANTGGSDDRTRAYTGFMDATTSEKGRKISKFQDANATILFSEDDDDEDELALRGY